MVRHLRFSVQRGPKGVNNIRGDYAFYFPAGEEWNSQALEGLAVAMGSPVTSPGSFRAALPPVTVPLIEFVLHDISNPVPILADEAARASQAPALRFGNLHSGRLALECLYGPSPDPACPDRTPFGELLRDASDRARLKVGRTIEVPSIASPMLPLDRAADLPRLAAVKCKPAEAHASREHVGRRLAHGCAAKAAVAVIGDARNDSDLFLAQLHLMFLRFHNFLVERYRQSAQPGGEDEVFDWASRLNRFHYQWLVVNVFLPSFCDPGVIGRAIWSNAQLHWRLLARHHGASDHHKVPLEFSAAAFRLGPSIRPWAYDWNAVFGRGPEALRENAPLPALIAMTGRDGAVLTDTVWGRDFGGLPSYWLPDWGRLCGPFSEFADRCTRAINTELAGPLPEGAKAKPEHSRHGGEAFRILEEGRELSLASAQTCVGLLCRLPGAAIELLTPDQLASGHTGRAVREAGFDRQTPLWFYILKEAELREGGQRLGPLGSLLVAETIVGTILRDPDAYWNCPGSREGRWHPVDAAPILGHVVDSIPAMIRAAGLL